MGPAEPVRPVYSAVGSAAPGAGKRAVPAKRVALATRVSPLPGISRSVGNKNSSESLCPSHASSCSHSCQLVGPVSIHSCQDVVDQRVEMNPDPEEDVTDYAHIRNTVPRRERGVRSGCRLEMGFHNIGQAGLNLLTSGDLPAFTSQSARIIGMSHCAWPAITVSSVNLWQ
ncbi:Protein GVQW1 [Plecturocebus cupreus]